MATTEPIKEKGKVRELAEYWLKRGSLRNHALIVLGVCTALRISDLLRISWQDVYDFEHDEFHSHITITEKKTGKAKTIALNKQAIHALRLYFPHRRGSFIFASNRKEDKAISRVQAWRVLKEAFNAVKLVGNYSCTSMRKTFGYFAWKSGVLPAMLVDLYNHSSYEITKRYLGISQDERDAVYLSLALF